jgi:hypothetical protein
MNFDFESLTQEFIESAQFLFIDASVKEYAPGIFGAFVRSCSVRSITIAEKFTVVALENILLSHMAQLDLPLIVRREIPKLLKDFFTFLGTSGRYPPALSWVSWVHSLENAYQARFRDDGSTRGDTFTKKYTDVNRNDPCPCGSGKKFKKCCMGLIG